MFNHTLFKSNKFAFVVWPKKLPAIFKIMEEEEEEEETVG